MRATILVLAIFAVMLATSCIAPVRFEGTSMRPAIDDRDRLFVTTSDFEVKREDIIYFRYPRNPDVYYMKRVIGLPGESIEIQDGRTLINGDLIEESYVSESFNQSKMNMPRKSIPSGHYFVMGDNRDNSSDSRYWGTVEKSLIEGKYYWTYAAAESK